MNNSFGIDLDISQEKPDPVPLRERESKLLRLLETIQAFGPEWSTLKEELFDGRVESLEKLLLGESKKKDVQLPDLYRLQGRLSEVKRVASIAEVALAELNSIRKQLNPSGPTE